MLIRLKKYVFSPKTLFLCLSFFLALILSESLKNVFDNLIVNPILKNIGSSLIKDLTFLTVCVGIVIKMFSDISERKLISDDWIFPSLFYVSMYLFVRLQAESYSYTSFYSFQGLKYADTILIPIVLYWINKIYDLCSEAKGPIYKNKPFLVDVPISDSNNDELNRKKFAERIAKKIESKSIIERPGALAIGITGEWGSGKTSFSNMIKEALNKENRIIIHFNPWRSSSPEKIIEDFFELMISELRPYDHNLSNNIYSYAKNLTKVDENIITKGVQLIGENFEESSKNQIYSAIDESISLIKKQIIIFIDDLDRLDKMEITGVLRLIRNTANFNNLVYVVAYDKAYVLEAVKGFNESNYQAFLEKIFQFEFVLPYYRPEIIRSYLKAQLKSALPDGIHGEIEWAIESRAYKGLNITTALIHNHRTAIRLANAIVFEIEDVVYDVVFYDFYLLQIFKLKYLQIFNLFFENTNIFLVPEYKKHKSYLRLRLSYEKTLDNDAIYQKDIAKFLLDRDEKTDLTDDDKIPLFDKFLDEYASKSQLSESDKYYIKAILSELLDYDRDVEDEQKNARYKAFVQTENFHKYFAFQLEDGDIPAGEFESIRRRDFSEYLAKIHEWKDADKFGAFVDRISKIEFFANTKEFENQVLALFEIGRIYAAESNIHGFDYAFLISILKYPTKILNGSQLSLYSNLDEYKTFLENIFKKAPIPRGFENRLITLLQSGNDNKFSLSQQELSKLSLNNLRLHIENDLGLENQFWDTYNNTKIWNEERYSIEKNPDAETLAKEYYRKKLTACDLGRFIMQAETGSEYFYLDENRRTFAFSSMDNFEEWFSNAENIDRSSDCYKEFLEFFKTNKEILPNGTKWDFKYITPHRWI